MKGRVIVFDGPDGVGKTTQLKLTAEYLADRGYDVYTTRASGGTPIGEALRVVSLSDTERPPETDLYISLAMHTALGLDLEKRRKKGQICIVDRGPMAIMAYNTYGSELKDQQLGFDTFEKMMKLWAPDTAVFLDAAQSIVDERRKSRTGKPLDYFEKKGEAYHQRVRKGYEKALEILEANPDWGISVKTIDGAPTQDEVQAEIRHIVEPILK